MESLKLLAENLKIDENLIKEVAEKNKIFLLGDTELSTLKSKVQKEAYDKAHGIAYKNAIKDLGAKLELEIDSNLSFDEIKEQFQEVITKKFASDNEKLKQEIAKPKDEKIKEYERKINEFQTSLEKLQNVVKEKENLILSEKQNRFKDKANLDFQSELSKIQIAVPNETKNLGQEHVNNYIAKQYEIAKTIFESRYQYKFDENGKYLITDKEGNVLKDKMENPSTLNDIVTSLVTNYLQVTKQEIKGRGKGDEIPSNSEYSFKDENELFEHFRKIGINPSSGEAVKIYQDWIKSKK